MNIPPTIGMVVSLGKASMADLGSILGLEDLWDLMEIIMVDQYNRRLLDEAREREKKGR